MNKPINKKYDIYVVVYNSLGEIFIIEIPEPDPKKQYYQKYGPTIYGFAGSQPPKESAKSMLKEQAGLDKEVNLLGKIDDTYFFSLKYDGDLNIDSKYAEKGQWVSPEVIENMMLQDPDIFISDFLVFWNNLKDKLI